MGNEQSKAIEIVELIIEDLSDRKGLQNEWECIDEDIQEEIKQEWIDIVNQVTG